MRAARVINERGLGNLKVSELRQGRKITPEPLKRTLNVSPPIPALHNWTEMQPNLKKTATGWPQERTHPIRYGFNFTTHHSWGKFHRKERKQFLGQKVPQKNADNNLKGAATEGPTITSKMVVAEILWNGRVQLLRIILLFRPPPPYCSKCNRDSNLLQSHQSYHNVYKH